MIIGFGKTEKHQIETVLPFIYAKITTQAMRGCITARHN